MAGDSPVFVSKTAISYREIWWQMGELFFLDCGHLAVTSTHRHCMQKSQMYGFVMALMWDTAFEHCKDLSLIF